MNKSLNKIKDGILVWVWIILVLWIANAWTNLSNVSTGNTLTATLWNDMIAKINDIWARTDPIYNSSGNIWIGTNTPSKKFNVYQTTGHPHVMELTNTDATSATDLAFVSDSGPYWAIWPDWSNRNNINNNWFHFFNSSSSTVMLLDDNWKVWIWTNTPTEKLEVNGNVKMWYEIVTNDCVWTSYSSCTVSCTSWKYPTWGWCVIDNSARYIYRSYPLNNWWACHTQLNLENAGSVIRPYAICANIR